MDSKSPLDKFGKFLVENLRDKGIDFGDKLLNDEWKAPALLNIQTELSELTDSQKDLVKKVIISSLDAAVHDFLFALQQVQDVQILVDGESIVKLSDGIHGEAYTDEGWYAKYSKFRRNL